MKANSKQLNEFINYAGLYRDKRTHDENYIFCETIERRSKDFDWQIMPHIHGSLYQLFFAESGYAIVSTSEGKINLKAPFLVFIPPLNIHGFHFSKDIDGLILTFSDFYMQTLHEKHPNILESLDKIFCIHGNEVSSELQEFREVVDKIRSEFNSKHEDKVLMLEYLLYILIVQCSRYLNHHSLTPEAVHNNLTYLRKFQQLIKVSKNPFTSLQQYADQLHITTKHLNRICRSTKQMSALQVVQAELILKAKAHLCHFNSNVSEVAYELGFDDPSYFTRLFKKHTGLTPVEYRRKAGLTNIDVDA